MSAALPGGRRYDYQACRSGVSGVRLSLGTPKRGWRSDLEKLLLHSRQGTILVQVVGKFCHQISADTHKYSVQLLDRGVTICALNSFVFSVEFIFSIR